MEHETPSSPRRAVRQLDADLARKIAAGEVIDRPNAIVRELLDNAVDSGADRIDVEISGGGIERIRVVDNGCGMSREDLSACARPHATSKISSEADLLNVSTLGFRGEALSSMAAVSRLEITSGGWTMRASVSEDHLISPCAPRAGTIVQTAGLFENFPARRQFLKRPASEGALCRTVFEEKAIARPDIGFSFSADGVQKLLLPKGQSQLARFLEATGTFEAEELFYDIGAESPDATWSFRLLIGEPSVSRSKRTDMSVYVNGRKIQEYSLLQAIEYGCQGYFPNGQHPVACLFVTMEARLVDFNIHPAKREARFKDLAPLHHAVSTTVRQFFRQHSIQQVLRAEQGADTRQTRFHFERSAPPLSVAEPERRQGSSLVERYLAPTAASYGGLRGTGGAQNAPAMRDFSQGLEAILHGTDATEQAEGREAAERARPYTADGSFRFVGSALGTFLVAEQDDTLYLIDQHAAHERYLYNKIMAEAGQSQPLLVPYTLRSENAADDAYLEALQDALQTAGFTCENKGDGVWEFTTVPIRWKGSEADLARDILVKRMNPADVLTATAASTACRAAVMDGTVLDDETAAWIARIALELPDPHCPHGRPVYTTITRRQLFALVKRVQ